MTVDVLTETVIDRPLSTVSTYAADPDNVPAWYKNIKSVEWKTERPVAIGSQIAFVAQFMGRTLAYTYEVAEFEPEQKLVMATSEGPFPMETTYTWEAVNANQTKMTLRNRGEPAGFSKLAARFMAGAMRRANQKDLELLKVQLEAS